MLPVHLAWNDMIRFTSCMAPSMESTCRALTALAGERLSVETRFVGDIPWQERERGFRAGEIDVVWICGLPYVWNWQGADGEVELLAAPVMKAKRYGGLPVYFSDIVARRDAGLRSFSDLRGRRFAYNEPRSHSGYNVVRHHLASRGTYDGFFAAVVESGSHQASLGCILAGRVDAAAIDSTVLELELGRNPELAERVAAIDSLGPSPIPPWIVRTDLPPKLRAGLRSLLLELHADPAGRAILDTCAIDRFTTVADGHYDPIRAMAARAESVRLVAA